MMQMWKLLIDLINWSSSTKLSSPTFKNVYWLNRISHPGGQPWPRPILSHSSLTVHLSPLPRGLSWSLQQQRTVHSGGQRLALHLPIRMERGGMSRGHGNTLHRRQGQRRRYISVCDPSMFVYVDGWVVGWMNRMMCSQTSRVLNSSLAFVLKSLILKYLRNNYYIHVRCGFIVTWFIVFYAPLANRQKWSIHSINLHCHTNQLPRVWRQWLVILVPKFCHTLTNEFKFLYEDLKLKVYDLAPDSVRPWLRSFETWDLFVT